MTTRSSFEVREATTADAAAVASIYNVGICDRTATFETTERTADDVAAWLAERQDTGRPFLVATDADGTVTGWVRASTYRARPCYASIAEFSVYVAREARGRGAGDALMKAFVVACASAGVTKLVSRIFPENAASRALCARHGFREVGTYERHGRLDGVWRDVVIVERLFPDNLR
jgi:L-amino acid N-acyltransferase YncA